MTEARRLYSQRRLLRGARAARPVLKQARRHAEATYLRGVVRSWGNDCRAPSPTSPRSRRPSPRTWRPGGSVPALKLVAGDPRVAFGEAWALLSARPGEPSLPIPRGQAALWMGDEAAARASSRRRPQRPNGGRPVRAGGSAPARRIPALANLYYTTVPTWTRDRPVPTTALASRTRRWGSRTARSKRSSCTSSPTPRARSRTLHGRSWSRLRAPGRRSESRRFTGSCTAHGNGAGTRRRRRDAPPPSAGLTRLVLP